eukprot:m51a1_g8536 hypothetical protein (525) ;mRNA; r:2313-16828
METITSEERGLWLALQGAAVACALVPVAAWALPPLPKPRRGLRGLRTRVASLLPAALTLRRALWAALAAGLFLLAALAQMAVLHIEQSEEEEEVVERKGEEEDDDEDEDEDEEVSADDYKGTSRASQSDKDQRRALQEKQQISALMKKSRDLLIIFTAKPSEECAHQPCTFGEVRAGFKAMQMLLAGTLSNLIMRMNALTCTVEAGTQSRELMLREKLMLGIPVPELENLPPDRGPYTAALSVIMARPITSQIEQWTKVNYHPLFMEHPKWSFKDMKSGAPKAKRPRRTQRPDPVLEALNDMLGSTASPCTAINRAFEDHLYDIIQIGVSPKVGEAIDELHHVLEYRLHAAAAFGQPQGRAARAEAQPLPLDAFPAIDAEPQTPAASEEHEQVPLEIRPHDVVSVPRESSAVGSDEDRAAGAGAVVPEERVQATSVVEPRIEEQHEERQQEPLPHRDGAAGLHEQPGASVLVLAAAPSGGSPLRCSRRPQTPLRCILAKLRLPTSPTSAQRRLRWLSLCPSRTT